MTKILVKNDLYIELSAQWDKVHAADKNNLGV